MNSQQNQPLNHSQSSRSASGSLTLPTSLPMPQFLHTNPPLIPALQTYSPCPHNRVIPKTDQTNPVCTAANACHPDATAANNIAVTPAEAPPIANASVTLANSNCNVPVTPASCHADNNGKFAMPFNPVAHPEPQVPASPMSAPESTSTSGHTDTETVVSTPSQAGLVVTAVTLTTGRRHTSAAEMPPEAVHQAVNLLLDYTESDAKTAVATPSPAVLAVTAVTLATGRRHTDTNQQPSDISYDTQAASPTLPDATTESESDGSQRSCQYCAEPFQARSVKHKYCSNACRVYAHYVRHGGRKCKVCGQPTPSPSRSVCSEVCRAQLPYYRPGCYADTPTDASRE